MPGYSLKTPVETAADLAARARDLRLARGWKQTTLARRSGVSLASLRRFETTGQVSLGNLLKIALALHRLDDFETVFETPPASSVAELEARERKTERKRGRI